MLPDRLREAGAEVDVVALYETVREQLDDATRERIEQADYVTFTSSSTVRFFCEAIGGAERLPAGGARRLDRAGHERRPRASWGCEVDVEAAAARHRRARRGAARRRRRLAMLPVTFLSDYGHGDEYVGVCHGVIQRIAPGARR